MMKSILRDHGVRLLGVALLLILAGCGFPPGSANYAHERSAVERSVGDSAPPHDMGRPVMAMVKSRSRPVAHVWSYLYELGGESPGYATYSYVLAGHDDQDSDTATRYLKLVEEIRHSTSGSDELGDTISPERLNLFLIPATKSEYGENQTNYVLSKALLTVLAANSGEAFSRPGPYLITLYKPLCSGEEGEVADILYIDFTNIHPDAIPEVVRTYKNRVVDEGVEGIERLKSLRLLLLNMALLTEDSIGFAQKAYAELVAAFPE